MIPITDEPAAVAELSRLAQSDACPTLSEVEVSDILAKHKRGEVWAASTARQIGDRIIPTAANRNGHRYRVDRFVSTGTNRQNGTTEPSWSTTRESQHTDGNVIWVEDGWDWDAVLWDLTAAAEEAWMVKAGKSIARVDFAPAQGMSISASQLYDHCLKQAERFRSVYCL